jgi:hypothetical protein
MHGHLKWIFYQMNNLMESNQDLLQPQQEEDHFQPIHGQNLGLQQRLL